MIKNNCLPDCKIIRPSIFKDKRGHFLETFRTSDYQKQFKFNLQQINECYSHYGVIRGLHTQKEPFAQTKIIQVLYGQILDVIIDIRRRSATFGQIMTTLLDHHQKEQLYIPKGFLHGYAVLSENALIQYYVDEYYYPEYEIGMRYDDEHFNINWMIPPNDRILSDKDLCLPSFNKLMDQIS